MLLLRGTERERAVGIDVDPRARYHIFSDRSVELTPGVRAMIHFGRPPHLRHEEYQLYVEILEEGEPGEDEFLVHYDGALYRARKVP